MTPVLHVHFLHSIIYSSNNAMKWVGVFPSHKWACGPLKRLNNCTEFCLSVGSWDLDIDLSSSKAPDFIIMANRELVFLFLPQIFLKHWGVKCHSFSQALLWLSCVGACHPLWLPTRIVGHYHAVIFPGSCVIAKFGRNLIYLLTLYF